MTNEAGDPGATNARAPVAPPTRLDASSLPPDTPSDAGWWLVMAIVGYLVGQIAALLLTDIGALVTGNADNLNHLLHEVVPPEWFIIVGLVGTWVGFAGAPVLTSVKKGTRNLVADFGLKFRWVDLLGIPIGVASQYAIQAVYLLFESHIHDFTQRMSQPAKELTGSSHGIGFVVVAIFLVVGAPFCEELFFRGLLLRSLSRLLGIVGRPNGTVVAVVITGVLFAVAHEQKLQFFGLAAFGILLSVLALRTRRLGMGMLAHASFNLVAVWSIATAGALR